MARPSRAELNYGKTKPARKKPLEGQFQFGNKAAVGRGRPKKDPKLVETCRIHTPDCVKNLVKIMHNNKERTRDQLSAIEILLAYAWGKPKAVLDVNSTYDVTTEFLDALKEINCKATPSPKLIEELVIEDGETA